MKLEKLVGDRFKERPADCQVDSHALMIRGGYMKNVANGIYSSYMPLRRITRKIEQIIPKFYKCSLPYRQLRKFVNNVR